MLVLSRKEGEGIWIAPGIQVTVVAIQRGRVRLGFSGPREIPIHRGEVRRRIETNSARGDPGRPLCAEVEP